MINVSERYIMMNYKCSDLKKKLCNSRIVIIYLIIIYKWNIIYIYIGNWNIDFLFYNIDVFKCKI